MPTQNQIREQITQQIVEHLAAGKVAPWRRPWSLDRNAGNPANIISKKAIEASTRSCCKLPQCDMVFARSGAPPGISGWPSAAASCGVCFQVATEWPLNDFQLLNTIQKFGVQL